MDKISLIVPCFNEEESLPFLYRRLLKLFDTMSEVKFEVLMVDNCSTDDTLKLFKKYHEKDKRFDYISFTKNFGKEASMYAGLKYSTGDYVAIIDADLQDPPELVTEMYHILKTEDYDCVSSYRTNRKGEPFIRSFLASTFNKINNKLTKNTLVDGERDFRLMTREMVDAVLLLNEQERFLKGIFSWVGFKTKWIPFENQERMAGKTKLPTKDAFICAIRAISSFSTFPLYITIILGAIFFISSIIEFIVLIINYVNHTPNFDYKFLILLTVISAGFGFVLLILGIIGQYISNIYSEVKNRPKYIIKHTSIKKH